MKYIYTFLYFFLRRRKIVKMLTKKSYAHICVEHNKEFLMERNLRI